MGTIDGTERTSKKQSSKIKWREYSKIERKGSRKEKEVNGNKKRRVKKINGWKKEITYQRFQHCIRLLQGMGQLWEEWNW